MLKFLVCSVFVATASAGYLGHQGLHFNEGAAYAPHYENYAPHDYEFNYGVSDPHTGDHKSQWEVKEKGVVRGGYSLLEPDGTTRIVEYIADDDGFRAVVKKLGDAHHPDQVEAHGFSEPEIHHETPVIVQEPQHLVQPVIAAPEPQLSYHAYDGQADNYAHVLGDSQLQQYVPQLPLEKAPEVSFGYQHQPQVPLTIPQEYSYHQPQHHHQQFEPISSYQLPHESQGHLGNLQPINSYPTFSSVQPESHYLNKQPIDSKIFAYEQAPPLYSSKQLIGDGIIGHPQAFEVPSGGLIGHHQQHQAEVPIYQGQGQYYQGAVPHQQPEHVQPLPISVKSYVQPEIHQLPQTVDYSHAGENLAGYSGGYGGADQGYYQGEYSQKVQNVVAPPQKTLSHFKSEPFKIVVD